MTIFRLENVKFSSKIFSISTQETTTAPTNSYPFHCRDLNTISLYLTATVNRSLSLLATFIASIHDIIDRIADEANELIISISNILTSISTGLTAIPRTTWYLNYLRKPLDKYAYQISEGLNMIIDSVRPLTIETQQTLNTTTVAIIQSLSSIRQPIEESFARSAADQSQQKLKCFATYGHVIERNSIWQLQKYSTDCVEVFRGGWQTRLKDVRRYVSGIWMRISTVIGGENQPQISAAVALRNWLVINVIMKLCNFIFLIVKF